MAATTAEKIVVPGPCPGAEVERCTRRRSGEDASAFEPDGLAVTDPSDEMCRRLLPLPDEAGFAVVVDRDRMTTACGFVRKVG